MAYDRRERDPFPPVNVYYWGGLVLVQALLPGLAMTNAIRDTVMGDLVSGTARAAEALLVAVAIAAGVGSVLSLYISLGGVI